MFEEKEDADGRCWTNEGLEFDAIDMQEEEEGFDIKMFNREDDELKLDDANDNFEEQKGIDVSEKEILKEEEDIVDIL